MSTDFAVQNVLLQMRLKAYGPEGYRIRQVKSWLLRCHACYAITRQLERRFCDKCGGATLLRTSYMVDAQGQTHLFLKRDFQYNLRGTKTPLPMPKAGRGGNTVLLREDQKEYQQAMKSYQRQEKRAAKMTDLDAIDDRLATVFGGLTFKGAAKLEMPSQPVIGFGRRNPNQARRRV
jgi:RNA-binding protein NOB1